MFCYHKYLRPLCECITQASIHTPIMKHSHIDVWEAPFSPQSREKLGLPAFERTRSPENGHYQPSANCSSCIACCLEIALFSSFLRNLNIKGLGKDGQVVISGLTQ